MYLSRVTLRDDISTTQLPLLLRDREGYGLHRLFWDLFSDGNRNTQKRDFLFREEIEGEQSGQVSRRKGSPIYYVLSKQAPITESPLFMVESKIYRPVLSEGERVGFKLRVNAVVSREGKRHDIVMDEQRSWLHQQLKEMGVDTEGSKNELKKRVLDHAADCQLASWAEFIKTGRFSTKLSQTLGRADTLEWAIKTAVEKRIQNWWRSEGERMGFDVALDQGGEPLVDAVGYRKYPLPEKSAKASFNGLDLSGEIIIRNVDQFKNLLFDGVGPAKAFGCGLMMIRRL